MGAASITELEWTRPTALGGLGIVLSSVVSSIVAYGQLSETVRIRWTVGPSVHYGPEHAPTVIVLTAFPVVLVGLYLGTCGLSAYLERTQDREDREPIRLIFDICLLMVLGIGLISQLGLIVLNL